MDKSSWTCCSKNKSSICKHAILLLLQRCTLLRNSFSERKKTVKKICETGLRKSASEFSDFELSGWLNDTRMTGRLVILAALATSFTG